MTSISKQPIFSSSYANFGSVVDDASINENKYEQFNRKNRLYYFCSLLSDMKFALIDSLRVRNQNLREFMAELFGTFIFISFSLASVAQYKFNGQNSYLSVNVSFGFGLSLAIIAVGKVSANQLFKKGGHLNPAVSLSMLLMGRMTFFRFFIYVLGQFIGAFIASLMVFLVYLNQLQKYPAGMYSLDTAGIFGTYPNDPNDSTNTFSNFFDQFFATSLFIISILAITDKSNSEIPHAVGSILIGLLLLIIGTSFGFNCGFPINPARDLSPRIFTAIAGWGSQTFSAGNYFFWIPIIGPMFGSIFGTILYNFFIGNNWPNENFAEFSENN